MLFLFFCSRRTFGDWSMCLFIGFGFSMDMFPGFFCNRLWFFRWCGYSLFFYTINIFNRCSRSWNRFFFCLIVGLRIGAFIRAASDVFFFYPWAWLGGGLLPLLLLSLWFLLVLPLRVLRAFSLL